MLQAGIEGWPPLSVHKGMTTSKMAILLRWGLGVSFVAFEIQKYKDAVLFGFAMAWGVEIHRFDPQLGHALVSFAIWNVLSGAYGNSLPQPEAVGPRVKNLVFALPEYPDGVSWPVVPFLQTRSFPGKLRFFWGGSQTYYSVLPGVCLGICLCIYLCASIGLSSRSS